MRRKLVTPEMEIYIEENYQSMSRNEMAKHLGIGLTPIGSFMKNNGLSVTKKQSLEFARKAMKGKTTFTAEEDNYIIENYLNLPVKTIGKNIGRSGSGVSGRLKSLGLIIPRILIDQRKKESQFSKGSIPFTKGKRQSEYMSPEAIERTKKTRYKKGNIPGNAYAEDGVITIRHDHVINRKYKWIRISLGEWKMYHRFLWEEKYGPIPKGYCLWFKDGDSLNCEPENLELITKAENVIRNGIHQYPKDVQENIKLMNKIKKNLNNHDRRRSE